MGSVVKTAPGASMRYCSVALLVCSCHYDGYSCVFQKVKVFILVAADVTAQSNSHKSEVNKWLMHDIRSLTLRLDIWEVTLSAKPDGNGLSILRNTPLSASLFPSLLLLKQLEVWEAVAQWSSALVFGSGEHRFKPYCSQHVVVSLGKTLHPPSAAGANVEKLMDVK